MRNKTWGRLFGYRGSFEVEWLEAGSRTTPSHILPRRQGGANGAITMLKAYVRETF